MTSIRFKSLDPMAAKRYREALADVQAAARIPDNLPTERMGDNPRATEIAWSMGAAYEALGDAQRARQCFEEAAKGGHALGHREQAYYQALALRKTGRAAEAQALLEQLTSPGQDAERSGRVRERPLTARTRKAAAHYAAALGHLGLNRAEQARAEVHLALEADPSHAAARALRANLAAPRP